MGERGAKQFGAPLADPTAVPNLNYKDKVDKLLRTTVSLLLDGSAGASTAETSQDGKDVAKCLVYGKDVAKCLAYLREQRRCPPRHVLSCSP